jgi:biopolymer transport protein TolR
MGMSTRSGSAIQASINVTPLVDVVLVLLIIFMVVTPLVQLGYTIDVPGRGNLGPPAPPVVLEITASQCPLSLGLLDAVPIGLSEPECRVRLGKDLVSLSDLPARVAGLFEHPASNRVLYISAEESLNYQEVLRIVDAAKSAAGPDLRIAIVTSGSGA